MSRPAPRLHPREIVTRGWLDPSGNHTLEVAIPSGIVTLQLSVGQVEMLDRAIDQFRARIAFEDGRADIIVRRPFAIEVR